MKILPEPIAFEWDKGNIDKNLIKHRVTNQEAEEIFDSEPKFIFEDQKHSVEEKRYMIWGATARARRLSAFFTIRKGKVRIISARDMHQKERREYEKKIKENSNI
ncbi:MAG: hypothetical protein ACD_37C00491G0002 [uncultured bacterium]|nr:MAG: hypothetical protein ACD_37C00491G0002 [uncultured bacterium]